ncbi:MAG: hypothetical protein LBQ30_01565 [Treponema sp.]|nr:hypothetical protein [Treponema sp.]
MACVYGPAEIIPIVSTPQAVRLTPVSFFGFTRSEGYQLIRGLGLTSKFSDFLMSIPSALTRLLHIVLSKHNHPPRASGAIFDRGKQQARCIIGKLI